MIKNPMADEMRRFKGTDEKNPFEAMSERFDRAAQLLGLDADLYAVMRVPSREIKVYIPVRMDSGHIEVFEGFRVQHNFARGPAKGGIRYAPDVTLDEVKDLHGLILAGREGAGMFRSQPVRISGSDHRPPATWREVMDAMETWEHWSLSQPAAPALLRAAVLHAWLVHIHPFLDGNGRTARAVANLELIRKGYPPIIIRKKDRRQYLDALHRSDEADLAPLLELFEARLQDALRDLERTAATKQGYSPAIARIRQRQQQTVQIWNAALTLLAQRVRECLDEALVDVGGPVSKWNLDLEPLELEDYIQLCNMKSISRSWWLQVELQIPGIHRVERLGWIGFRSNELMAATPELAREPSIFWSVPSGGYPVWRRAVPSECPFVQEFSLQGDRWACLGLDGRVIQLLPGELARKVAEGLIVLGVG